MADERSNGDGLPQPSEAVHLPGPSYLPVVVALGTTLALVGVVFNWVVFGIGLLIALVGILRWLRDTRQDIAELPLDH